MYFHRKPITYISDVKLRVQDLEKSIDFYQNIVGFKILNKKDRIVQLTADGETVLLTLEQPVEITAKQPRTTGLYHFALLLPKKSDLANFIYHLSHHQVAIGASDHHVSEAIYFSDPEGNGIEVYVDRDPKHWKWQHDQVMMVTEPLRFRELLVEGTENGWNGLPEDTMMGHIHLHVSELNQSEAFYTKGLGFEVVTRYGTQALFLSDGKYHHHIGMNTWQGVGAPKPDPHTAGLDYFTIVYADEEKRQQIIHQLRTIGAMVEEMNGAFYTEDPSGNLICLQI